MPVIRTHTFTDGGTERPVETDRPPMGKLGPSNPWASDIQSFADKHDVERRVAVNLAAFIDHDLGGLEAPIHIDPRLPGVAV